MNPDLSLMKLCVANARKAKGFTKTNPLVGAAVVKDGSVIAEGIHEQYGLSHAEVNALNKAGSLAKGADLYVTLEPCSSYGKTPPCTEKIIASGIKRVFIGCVDVNPKHAGTGIDKLRLAGIETVVGVACLDCALLIEDFIKSQKMKLPYVTLKTAVSADGKIAASSGDSKWVTGEKARKLVHDMRSLSDAVLTGIGTVLADNPTLNNRNKNAKRQPSRVVLDSFCRTPVNSNLVKTAAEIPLFIYVCEKAPKDAVRKLEENGAVIETVGLTASGHLDIKSVLESLYTKNIMNVFVEAGSNISGSFNDGGFIDRLEEFIAPKIIGGVSSPCAFGGSGAEVMAEVKKFASASIMKIGEDFLLSARVNDYAKIAVDATTPFTRGF